MFQIPQAKLTIFLFYCFGYYTSLAFKYSVLSDPDEGKYRKALRTHAILFFVNAFGINYFTKLIKVMGTLINVTL